MHKTYTINGMTCEHCVKAITEEVSALDGVATPSRAETSSVIALTQCSQVIPLMV